MNLRLKHAKLTPKLLIYNHNSHHKCTGCPGSHTNILRLFNIPRENLIDCSEYSKYNNEEITIVSKLKGKDDINLILYKLKNGKLLVAKDNEITKG